MNGLYQVVGEALQPVRDKLVFILHLNRDSLGHKAVQILRTFILVDFSWIFFRADNMADAISIVKSMITVYNPWILFDNSLYACGLSEKSFQLMIIAIFVLAFADFCKLRKIRIRDVVIHQDYWFQWIFIALAVAFILTFGIWGPNYNAANFIYFQF